MCGRPADRHLRRVGDLHRGVHALAGQVPVAEKRRRRRARQRSRFSSCSRSGSRCRSSRAPTTRSHGSASDRAAPRDPPPVHREERHVTEISALFHGFAVVLTPFNLLLMLIGIVLGVIIGVLPGPGRRQRRGDPAAAHVHDAADVRDHHAVLHLLGRAVRRRDHVGAVQHPGRALVGRDDVRRLSDGAAGPGGRSADRGVHLVVHRRAVRRDHDHLPRAAGREVRAEVRAAGVLLRLPADVLQLHRHGQGLAVQDAGGDDAGLCARGRRDGQQSPAAAADLRLHRADARLRFPDRGDRSVRHRRDPALDGGRPVVQRQVREDQSQGGSRDVEEVAGVTG